MEGGRGPNKPSIYEASCRTLKDFNLATVGSGLDTSIANGVKKNPKKLPNFKPVVSVGVLRLSRLITLVRRGFAGSTSSF